MSGLATLTPAPSTELPTIYRSGDLVLQNPQETCIIFVAVILISALLEFSLQRISGIDNKYARTLVTTMSQEVTIIGVLALLLMFTVSVIPKRIITPLYVNLFSWANMSLFFMATFFVLNIVAQFFVAALSYRYWKSFEEGRMDSDEAERLGFFERRFKLCYTRYAIQLEKKAALSPSALPFYEYVSTTLRKQLVRASNLSYRTWLSLSVVVLANLLRTMLTPFVDKTEDSEFYNALMYVGVVGWGTFLVFGVFFGLLQYRLLKYAVGDLKPPRGDPRVYIPFGTPKRSVEFLQVIIMTINWYLTLFVTGNAKQIGSISTKWKVGVVYALFAIPLLSIIASLPWVFYSIAMLTTIGGMKTNEAQRMAKVLKGEADASSDMDSDEDEGIAPQQKRLASDKGSKMSALTRARSQSVTSGGSGGSARARPAWLEEDDDWDGYRTLVPGTRRMRAVDRDRTFYSVVNSERVRRMLSRHEDPAVAALVPPDPEAATEPVDDAEDQPQSAGRPSWWEPEDDEPRHTERRM
jgi:hypothetical protein